MKRTKRKYEVVYAFGIVTVAAYTKREAIKRAREKTKGKRGIFCYAVRLYTKKELGR